MKALIVEDSRLAREGLAKMLVDHPSLDIVGKAKTAEEARELITKTEPDVLFLDIHLPGESGLELLQSLDALPYIIFTTAYTEYAINSFDYPTIDYLLKPISKQRLQQAVEKLFRQTTQTEPAAAEERKLDMSSKVFIKDGDDCHLVTLSDIEYFESCKNYVRAFFNENRAFIKKNMTRVEASLPAEGFFRANRQFLVNLNHISAIEPSIAEGYELTLNSGKTIEVSRRNAGALKDRLSF